ncbi:MAG: DNA-processing protein DprA [Burkholderiaceae bacterium]|nr:DNA-processing protein DprA [Burkholderiaceae bacterium]MDO9088928.1 DNA-processing protein DprA [Burkholderiaceae bacterium]
MDREELAAWLHLTLTPGIGNERARKLLAAFGPPQRILGQPLTALTAHVGAQAAAAVRGAPPGLAEQIEATVQWLSQSDGPGTRRQVLTLGDADYPAALLDIEDPPLMLYLMGHEAAIEPGRGIAMVGSRNPTPQGVLNARQFAQALVEAGLCVVSGLARGIDGAAHEGALAAAQPGRLATIAVVGTGLDRVYPKAHLALARAIVAHGLILSEYPMGTPPLAAHFPQRNRLIAGLSQGTLVVEAALQSGSLITARMAAEQGREVFAIPGSIHSPQSRGCHALIRQGAKLVESAADVLEELQPAAVAATAGPGFSADAGVPMTRLQSGVLDAMGFDPVGLDALVARTGMSTAALQGALLELELAGQLARLGAGLFQRIART